MSMYPDWADGKTSNSSHPLVLKKQRFYADLVIDVNAHNPTSQTKPGRPLKESN